MRRFLEKYLFLIILIFVAFCIRYVGSDWDSGYHLHPDERFLSMVLSDMRTPSSFGEYWDPEESKMSPFNNNSRFYVYGGLPITLVKYTAVGLDDIFHPVESFDSYARYHQIGRFYSTLCDIGILIVIYLIATKYFSRKAAIFTVLLYAVCVLPIQQSNFFTMDSFATFFMILALKFALDFLFSTKINSQVMNILLVAVFMGMACGSKYSSLIEMAFIGLVVLISFIKSLKHFTYKKFLWTALRFLMLGIFLVLVFYITFRLVQPFIFADSNFFNIQFNQYFLDAFNYQYDLGNGKVTAPFTIQWFLSINYLTPFVNLFVWSIGVGTSICAVLGIFISLFKRGKKDNKAIEKIVPFLLLFFIVLIFVYFGGSFMKYVRYFYPLVPIAIIFAGYFLAYCDDLNNKLIKGAAVVLLIAAQLWGFAFLSIYTKSTTRISASEWFYNNIESGKSVGHEVWDDVVPMAVSNTPHKEYIYVDVDMYMDDTELKIEYIYNYLEQVDYVVLASSRQSGSVGKLYEKYPYSSKYYQLLFNEDLGFKLVHKETSFPSFLGIDFNDEWAEESVFIYEHPSIWIFEKENLIAYDEFVSLIKNE